MSNPTKEQLLKWALDVEDHDAYHECEGDCGGCNGLVYEDELIVFLRSMALLAEAESH